MKQKYLGSYEELQGALGRLLAVIHGDGGHHFDEYGLDSVDTAIVSWYEQVAGPTLNIQRARKARDLIMGVEGSQGDTGATAQVALAASLCTCALVESMRPEVDSAVVTALLSGAMDEILSAMSIRVD